ncbi:hypothetical protein HYH03_008911 [Edaphochlamys debaryana]|uniref:WPP domain-containing protein n=1 Tax=Edaphochlamys debaryana TaxID=47281 RepID=A0A836BXN5_9CHLO|nr:hypothetical protein HYH03_008911 [Edaphochlamys debaryana]|eukprot:KAG2492745.1 hypothetical protein HYH03_008911 [Edaphochlamys debaryana]
MWSLTAAQREDVVQRLVASICALAHARGQEITAEVAEAVASGVEKKAYTAAEVAARTTTGSRPLAETTSNYARKLGELAIQAVKDGCQLEGAPVVGASGKVEHIDLHGSRDFLTAESTEALLAPMLAPESSVTKIRFSTKSFGRDAAAVAARAIGCVASILREADISDVIAGRPEDEALDALRVLSSALAGAPGLTVLNLSDNALGEKGVRACEAVLAGQAPIESLSLQNVGLSVHACRATAELLAGDKAGSLKRLQLFNNMSGDEGAAHIASLLARAPKLEDLRFASSRVGPAGGIALAKSLSAGHCLVKLDLSDNPLTSEVAAELAKALAHQPRLSILNLNDTSLGPDGVVTLCQGLLTSYGATDNKPAHQLTELGLALNEVDPAAAKAVAALVAAHAGTLRSLNLRENELADRGAVTIARALAAVKAPVTVDLVGNQIKRVGVVAVAKAVAPKASLELLALDENFISEEGMDELRSVMAAAGKAAALGPLDENMEEDDEEDDEDEDDGEDYGLGAALQRLGV